MSNEEGKVQRNVGRNRVQEKPKDFKKSIKKLLSHNKKLIPFYVIAVTLAIASSICSIIGPNKLSDLTDVITKGLMTGINFKDVKAISLFLLILYLTSAVFNFLTSFIMAWTANRLAKDLRTKISIKINKLPLRFFDKHSYGDVLSRVTNDVDTIGTTISHNIGTFASSVALFISAIIMMFYTNYIMALTAILTALVGFIFMFVILGKSQKYFLSRQVELGNLNGHIEEMYSGYNVVKVYNGKNKAIKIFKDLNFKLFDSARKSQFLSGLMRAYYAFYWKLKLCSSMRSRSNFSKK